MATAEAKSAGVVITLELSAEEAQYVAAALQRADPTRLEEDSVYDPLLEAMDSASVPFDHDAARSF